MGGRLGRRKGAQEGEKVGKGQVEGAAPPAEGLVRQLLDDAFELVFAVDAEGRLVDANQAALDALGLERSGLMGSPLVELVRKDRRDAWLSLAGRVMRGEWTGTVETLLVGAKGRELAVEGSLIPLFMGGKFVTATAIFREAASGARPEERQEAEAFHHKLFDLLTADWSESLAGLEERELRYRMLFQSAPIGILIADRRGAILDVNPAILRILGSPSAEATKAINLLTFPPLVDAGVTDDLHRCIEKGEVVVSEHPYTTVWGKRIHLRYHLSPVKDAEGAVKGVHAFVEDFTALKQAQDALRESEERFRGIFERSAVGIARVHLDGRIFETNPALQRFFGYTGDELRGKLVFDLSHPEDMMKDYALVKELVAGKRDSYTLEKRFFRKDGAEVVGNMTASMIQDPNGKPQCIVAVVEDVTSRARQQSAPARAMESSNEIMFVAQDGKLRFFNRRAAAFMGRNPKDLASLPITSFIHPDDQALVMERHKRRIAGEQVPNRYRFRVVDGKGALRWVEIYAMLIDWEGKPATLNILTEVGGPEGG